MYPALIATERISSNTLERQRHALADADAHGGERAPAAARLQPVQRGERDARPRHAERMAERDRAAMGIDVLGIVGDAELAQAREPLRGEGLVDLDQVEVADLDAEPRHQLAGRGHRADPHHPRWHRRRRHPEDAPTWSEPMAF